MSGGAASKLKGGRFERELCERLSLWVTAGETKDVFWRSSMSGGRGTVKAKTKAHVPISGDITAIQAQGHVLTDHFHIEAKHLKQADLASCLFKGTGVTAKAWTTCLKQARRHGKLPMLIVRQDRFPALVVTRPCQYEDRCAVHARLPGATILLLDELLAQPFTLPRLKLGA